VKVGDWFWADKPTEKTKHGCCQVREELETGSEPTGRLEGRIVSNDGEEQRVGETYGSCGDNLPIRKVTEGEQEAARAVNAEKWKFAGKCRKSDLMSFDACSKQGLMVIPYFGRLAVNERLENGALFGKPGKVMTWMD